MPRARRTRKQEQKTKKDLEQAETQLKKLVMADAKNKECEESAQKRREEKAPVAQESRATWSGRQRRPSVKAGSEDGDKERSRSRRGRRTEESSLEEADREAEEAVLEREREIQEDAKDRRSSGVVML